MKVISAYFCSGLSENKFLATPLATDQGLPFSMASTIATIIVMHSMYVLCVCSVQRSGRPVLVWRGLKKKNACTVDAILFKKWGFKKSGYLQTRSQTKPKVTWGWQHSQIRVKKRYYDGNRGDGLNILKQFWPAKPLQVIQLLKAATGKWNFRPLHVCPKKAIFSYCKVKFLINFKWSVGHSAHPQIS